MTCEPTQVTHSAEQIARLLDQPPPTEEQINVIQAPLEPLLVVAGAGSGKTETMAARVVYLVANGLVPAGQVLGLTFTRKAAAELSTRIRTRLRQLFQAGVGPEPGPEEQPRIATYNSYAATLLTDHALRVGLDPDARLISDAGRFLLAEHLVHTWPHDLDTGYATSTVVDAVTALAAELAEHGLQPQEAARDLQSLSDALLQVEGRIPKEIRDVGASLQLRARLLDLVEQFDDRKARDGVVDFPDQVRMAAQIAHQAPRVGEVERSRYPVVLLDEYQDTSVAQVQMLTALFGGGHPVTAVGDPNQAIYGWRGAAAGTLLAFPQDFPARSGRPAPVAPLSTAWRNDTAILDVANRIAEPLRAGAAAALVPALRPSPAAGLGTVLARCAETSQEEAATIAELLREHWSGDPRAPVTAAVLCRKRSQFPVIEEALTAAGLPCQVVGLGGLLATAEVADIRAALTVAHDPSRGDAMMRLLTGPSVHLGAADLSVLWDWAAAQTRAAGRSAGPAPTAGRSAGPAPTAGTDGAGTLAPETRGDAEQVLEDDERSSLVEAVDHLPRNSWTDRHGRALSDAGRMRLQRLSAQIRRIRSLSYLDMAELVTMTEQILGVDIEVIAHVPGSVAHARRNLDAFTSAAASFTGGSEEPSLGAFLSYLDAVEVEERGLDLMVAEPDPTAIQIMTVHAAKGLEWDTVVVAGLNSGDFPTVAPNKDGHYAHSGWLTDVGLLPYSMRGDRQWLPGFAVDGATTVEEVRQARADFRRAEGERLLSEERRLAYVAMTRAKHVLILTRCFWGTRAKASPSSQFLEPLVREGLADPGEHWPETSTYASNPVTTAAQVTTWPQPAKAAATAWERLWADPAGPPDHHGSGIRQVSEDERAVPTPHAEQWREEAELLLAERETGHAEHLPMPDHLSASAMVDLARDPEEFWRHRRRPVPRRPSTAARRGTDFHHWVEQYYGARSLLDWEMLPGAQEDGPDQAMAELQEAFLKSDWATQGPIAIEVDIETLIRGVAIRSRIDAVFRTAEGVHVVDWKTGTPPRDDADRHAAQVQLGLYRLAWSRLHQVPIETVRASLHYVAQNRTITAEDFDEAQLEALLQPGPDPAGSRSG